MYFVHLDTKLLKHINLLNFQEVIITIRMIFQAESCKVELNLLVDWSVYNPLTLHSMTVIVWPTRRVDHAS